MIKKSRRKELLREYAERKPQTGVFAVTCSVTGEAWVGWSMSTDKRQNGLWTQLRFGSSPERTMQAAWTAHGEAAMRYEVLEAIEEDNPHALRMKLEDRARHWRAELKAGSVTSR